MRILVTGANGFIGSALCICLTKAGHEVRRAVRRDDGAFNTFEVSDVVSSDKVREALQGVECIIHLAGMAHFIGTLDSNMQTAYEETNVQLTKRLALIAHDAGVRRIVFVSSVKVCGEASHGRPLTENSVAPATFYADTKWEAEQALRVIEKESGIEVVIIRPPLVYGVGVKANFLRLLSAVHHGIPLPFSLLMNKRSFIYLPNLISALSLCVVHPKAAGETFHVSDNESVAMVQLVDTLAMAMKRKARIFPCPRWVLLLAGRLVGKYQQVSSFVNEMEVDSAKIRDVLGWSPPYTFLQGIQETVEWYLCKVHGSTRFLEKSNERNARRKVCQLCAVGFTLKYLLLPLIDGMRDKGWSVTSVCSSDEHIEELRQRGYRHFSISISRNIFDASSHLRTVCRLYKLFRRERFDVLHVHTPIAAILGRIAGKLAGVPLIVYTAHGFYFHDEMPKYEHRFFVYLERLCGRLTDLIFTQSSEDAHSAVAEGIAEQKDVVVIGNGVNVDIFDPDRLGLKSMVRKALGIPEDACVVGVVSRLVREKGLVEFLDAAVELGKHFPKVYFLMVGKRLLSDHNASIEPELKDARNKLGSRLIATGHRADVADLLGTMDIFCLPSYREGMPRSIIEAMMMELPVVATNIRGSREEVIAGETGLLVPTHSSAALVQALGRLIADPDLSRRMGKAGRQRALELYDERRVVARQIDVITARCLDV